MKLTNEQKERIKSEITSLAEYGHHGGTIKSDLVRAVDASLDRVVAIVEGECEHEWHQPDQRNSALTCQKCGAHYLLQGSKEKPRRIEPLPTEHIPVSQAEFNVLIQLKVDELIADRNEQLGV